jgi:hypothetical protein
MHRLRLRRPVREGGWEGGPIMDNFWVAFIAALIYIPLFLVWVFAMVDIFGRRDLSGWGKAGWLIAVILLPFVGTLIYLIARPMTQPELERAVAAEDYRAYVSPADELERLSRLHDAGRITDDEYARLKMQVVGAA